MMVSPPDFTPTEFRPTISQTVNSVSTAKNGIFGLDFSYFGSNERVLRLLVEFKSLRNNWDNEGALAPDQAAIYQAERLVKLLQIPGEKVFHAAPGPNGEVMIQLPRKTT